MTRRATPEQSQRIARIVTQYRTRHAAIYELDCRGVPLDVHVSGEPIDAPEPERWKVEAHHGHADGAAVIAGSGATAAAALEDAARIWKASAHAEGLPELDWTDVTRALQAVRAI